MRCRRKTRKTLTVLILGVIGFSLFRYFHGNEKTRCSGVMCIVDNVKSNADRVFQFFGQSSSMAGPILDFVNYPCAKMTRLKEPVRRTCVRRFNESEADFEGDCIHFKLSHGYVPLCVGNASIAVALQDDGYSEYKFVRQVTDVLLTNPDLQFMDIGSGLGMYALSAGKLGRKVVVVDPVINNLRLLSKSAALAKLSSKVSLFWNVVLNSNRVVRLSGIHDIPARYVLEQYNTTGGGVNSARANYLVHSVQLDDFIDLFHSRSVFLRIDMGVYDLNVTLGASLFLEKVDVRYILLNLATYKASETALALIDFLTDHKFDPYSDARRSRALNTVPDPTEWPDHVFWIKTY